MPFPALPVSVSCARSTTSLALNNLRIDQRPFDGAWEDYTTLGVLEEFGLRAVHLYKLAGEKNAPAIVHGLIQPHKTLGQDLYTFSAKLEMLANMNSECTVCIRLLSQDPADGVTSRRAGHTLCDTPDHRNCG